MQRKMPNDYFLMMICLHKEVQIKNKFKTTSHTKIAAVFMVSFVE